ncbi:MAG TPA: beta-ketoacyl synthase N-terminal-like domain-containing protein [Vicinamibacterales bacterium]|nr:beta-ketoacyl synthase N-terminal-like domain-containing protein [Vicinamibacterales bacterium]
MQRSVRVVGMGAVSPFGTSLESFRDALLQGRTGIARITDFDTKASRSTLAASVTGFDAPTWIPPMKLRRMDRTGAYAIAASSLAMDAARQGRSDDGMDDSGVMLGTWTAGGQATQDYLSALFKTGPSGAPALLFNSTVANAAASLVGLEFKLRGPNATISYKEASGLAAIVSATELIREGHASALAAGGVDAVYEIFFKAYDRFRVMSPVTSPDARLAPFDASRSGFVLGEGGYMLWLEQDGAWESRGATAHGEILGVGASSAAVALNAWPDAPAALARTMRLALDDAGLTPADVDVVYASANATSVLDRVEAEALEELFGSESCVITSIKGAIGESGASGSAACIAALVCGKAGRVPPIAGLSKADAAAKSLKLAATAVDAPGPIVLVNSFASGGALFSVVLHVN